jgi:hypothetical protein
MAWRRFIWMLVFAWSLSSGKAEEGASSTAENATEEDAGMEAQNVTEQDRAKMMIACRTAIWKKWSSNMQEVGELVNMTLAQNVTVGEDGNETTTMNYSEATRILAVAQLASCARSVTLADIAAATSGELSDAAAERLLGGPALGLELTEEEKQAFDNAVKNHQTDSDAPQMFGVQVHNVPLFLQIFYMVAVVGAMFFVVLKVQGMLTSREKEKAETQEKKKMEKEQKREGKNSGSKKQK